MNRRMQHGIHDQGMQVAKMPEQVEGETPVSKADRMHHVLHALKQGQ